MPTADARPQLIIDRQGFCGGSVNALAFSPDGSLLAAAGDVVRIWELGRGKLVHTLRGQRGFAGVGGCTDLAFSPDGRWLLVAASGSAATLRVYAATDPTEIREALEAHEGQADRVAFSPDGRWLLSAGIDNRLHVWDWPSRRIRHTLALERQLDYLGFPSSRSRALIVDVEGDCTTVEPDKVEKNLRTLKRLAEIFEKYKTYDVRIEGHAVNLSWADPAAAEREEKEELAPLSLARAEAVKAALADLGMDPRRITTAGLGGRFPVVPHGDLDNRWKNRRVEFVLVRPDRAR